MTTFYLVRHGACAGLGEKLWGRTAGICLNDEGKAQAQQLAERFKGIALKAIYSSPIERAVETAESIARIAQLEVKQTGAFNEINFGDWAGKSFDELAGDEHWQRFNRQRSLTNVPGGELFLEVQARVVTELERLSQQHNNAHVAIVSHADVIKAAVGYVAGTPIDMLHRFEISPSSVTVIATDTNGPRLLAVNSKYELT
ncbi:MAG TPA: histidine phosphatase family protein [Pyrinomonadaceae bacterium]